MITADDKRKQAEIIIQNAFKKRAWANALLAEADADMVQAKLLAEEAEREQKAAELYT